MSQNLQTLINNFCFGYVTLSGFLETFPGGWLGGKYDFNENPVVEFDLDFELGFVDISWITLKQFF